MFYQVFNIKKRDIITVTGAGGKTSLIFKLAEELKKIGKVLITTTTKMKIPNESQYQICKINKGNKIYVGKNYNIDILCEEIFEDKIIGVNYNIIDEVKDNYDFILIEGDGAQGKFLKFWNENEPLIYEKTTKVIGVLNANIVGNNISEEKIHRFDTVKKEFKDYINFNLSNEDKSYMFLKVYFEKNEFFKNYDGEKYIYCNGIDKIYDEYILKRFLFSLSIYKILKKENIIYLLGSVKDNFIANPECDIIVLAAGYSKRYGETNKLELKINGKSLLEILLEKLKRIPTFNVIVVGQNEFVEKLSIKYNCLFMKNNNAHLGQSESVKLGISQIKNNIFAIFPCDQPLLTDNIILSLYLEILKTNLITIPVVKNNQYSPVFFPIDKKNKFLELKGDVGGKEIIKKEKNLNLVNFDDKKYFMDIDIEEDYVEVCKIYENILLKEIN
ncbi:selenium cofactor biosynthesis protein YqeC [Fusobacterium sp. PH5-44]|uniref:selenium cofactor biosynthesis protein YqeC n=1 Tax=unclassified Fusobacterium TaxID=2648384 RepID=UPI003D20CCB1